MSDPGVVEHRPSGLARYAPGLAQLRRYDRSWLRADLVAGLVLAAILVPQGMAYAQLAGLPAVTGLYTTVACLVGYAVFGPSRLLVLGPDSSVSPLIFAAIVPILGASKDPADAIVLAGMLALLVGAIEIGLGVAKLGFVADLLSKEVQVGYMNGLAIVIVVGQLPKLCRLLDRRRHLRHRDHELRAAPRPDEPGHPGRRARHAGSTARAAPVLAGSCRRSSSGSPARPSSPPSSTSPRTGSRRWVRCRRGCPGRASPGPR